MSSRLKERAADAALNVAGVARDLWGDFRRADRFFKLKLLIVATWAALSLAGIGVACGGAEGPSNTIGAKLVTSRVLDTQVFMVINESDRTWEDVVVEVNGTWRAAVARVPHQSPDNTLTLDPKRLLGDGGKPAPSSLQIRDLQVRTSRGDAHLMKDGRLLQ